MQSKGEFVRDSRSPGSSSTARDPRADEARGADLPAQLPSVPIARNGRPGILLPTLLSLQHNGTPVARSEPRTSLIYHHGALMRAAGLSYVEPGRFTSGSMRGYTLEEAKDAVGDFISVFRESETNDLLVLGDFHSFQKIFYTQVGPGRTLVSDSLLALTQELRARGGKVNIDAPTLVGQYGSFNALLNHHAFSSSTIVAGVRVLRADEVLRVTRAGMTIDKRARFDDPRGRDYAQLLSDALGRGGRAVSAALETGAAEHILYLSGGRDSRSVLAMALAGGRASDLPVFAKAPPPGRDKFAQKLSIDRAISSRLIEEFDLPLWEDRNSAPVSSGELEREWWLSHWAGVSHDYSSPGVGSLRPSMFLIGAMGENYRTKVPDFLGSLRGTSFAMTPEAFDKDFDTFFHRICAPLPRADGEAWHAARSRFKDSLTYEGVGAALWERLDAFSEVYRMSAHFGGASGDRSVNRWNLNVLALPELTYAATRLPREERAGGKIWRDLHDLADRRLNLIPYEYESLSAEGGYHRPPAGAPVVDWAALDQRHRANLARNAGLVSNRADRVPRRDGPTSRALLEKLRDVIAAAVGNARIEHLLHRIDEGSLLIKRLRGKLELLDELCDPRITWSAVHVTLS